MPDYQNSKIYKLVSNKTSDIYIGSCLMRLSTRLSGHRSKNNHCVSKKLFVADAIITIVLIEKFACNTKNELKARELHHITANNCININKPFVCDIPFSDMKAWKKEYYQVNSEQLIEKQKVYNESHKEQYSEYQKKYRDVHKAQNKEYNAINAEHIKEYKASHRDQINTRRRALYAEKKQPLKLESTLNKNIIV